VYAEVVATSTGADPYTVAIGTDFQTEDQSRSGRRKPACERSLSERCGAAAVAVNGDMYTTLAARLQDLFLGQWRDSRTAGDDGLSDARQSHAVTPEYFSGHSVAVAGRTVAFGIGPSSADELGNSADRPEW
jgi:hypothetical protein